MNWLTQCPLNFGEMCVLAFIGASLLLGLGLSLFCIWVAVWGFYDRWLEKRMTLANPDPAARRNCYHDKGATR